MSRLLGLFLASGVSLLLSTSPAAGEPSTLVTEWSRWWRELSTPREPPAPATWTLADPTTGEPSRWLTAAVTGGALVGAALNPYLETPRQSFHVLNEGFFGRDTYAGGADKAAHFVDYGFLSKELANFYGVLGYPRGQSILMGAGVASLAGLVNEVGDGTNIYGFSYEDLVMDMFGIGAVSLIAATRTEDLFGFRHGFLPWAPGGEHCCAAKVDPAGRPDPRQADFYSYEIYTADLKFAGAARRMGLNIGPLRYLLFAVTYGSSGYGGGDPRHQQRLVGFEIGLNLEAILNDVGVRRDTWWGYTLHVVFDNVRLPFTSIGARYDLNHGRWYGPGP